MRASLHLSQWAASRTPIQTTRFTSSSSMGSSGSGGFHGCSPSSFTTSAIQRVNSPGATRSGANTSRSRRSLADAPRRLEERADAGLKRGGIRGAHPFVVDVATGALPSAESSCREALRQHALGVLGA